MRKLPVSYTDVVQKAQVVDTTGMDVAPLNELLFDSNGLLKAVPAETLQAFPHNLLRVWCTINGVYQLPTVELINFLIPYTSGRSAIEICAGNGSIGRLLGIPRTDSYMQQLPEMKKFYKSLKNETTDPPPDVEKLDCKGALEKYNPEVVVGCFVTQKWLSDIDTIKYGGGSVVGVMEEAIVNRAKIYIKVGNNNVHGKARITKRPHQELFFPWLVSRAEDQTQNRIYLWEN